MQSVVQRRGPLDVSEVATRVSGETHSDQPLLLQVEPKGVGGAGFERCSGIVPAIQLRENVEAHEPPNGVGGRFLDSALDGLDHLVQAALLAAKRVELKVEADLGVRALGLTTQ